MRIRMLRFYDVVVDSFWLLPAVMAIFSLAAALGTVALDHAVGSDWVKEYAWIWSGGPDGARGVLTVIAGSVMTVVSIVFSITITALAQTSSHFGPRVLRNFTTDRGNQFVLGTFISTFIYCLIVLRTVRSVDESAFVPYLSVNIGIASSIVALAVLIYFIHHIAQSIQAEILIADVGHDFERVLPVIFPERDEHSEEREDDSDEGQLPDWKEGEEIVAENNGYLQRVNESRLFSLATRYDLVIRLDRRPGDFVTINSALLTFTPKTATGPKLSKQLANCFAIAPYRTPYQDIAYPLQQLVEIAAHALSPGLNEPFTALTCIDWLGACLRGIAQRDLPSPYRFDKNGALRVMAKPYTFDEMASVSFDQIRLYGSDNPVVVVKLLETITDLAEQIYRECDRQTLLKQTRLIQESSRILQVGS